MKNMPKIVLDEAERQGLDRMAAYLCNVDGREIYSLGVEDKEHWFPGPPNSPVLISLKDGKVSEFDNFWSIYDLLNRDEN